MSQKEDNKYKNNIVTIFNNRSLIGQTIFMKKNKLILFAIAFNPIFYFSQEKTKTEEPKEKQIEGVTITKTKKAVEQKADRTIFDFSEQPQLNSGTVMEGLKKLPGLIATDIAGMMYQGKMLDVYMDGRPLNISSNELQSFLEGMPANSVERIEIITQPGAEFPATSGGAILNIITSKSSKKYLSATYSGSYSFSNYDKYRSRTNNSIVLNARNKYFGWQLNIGQNYRESMRNGNIDNVSNIFTDQIGRGYFAKSALTFDLGLDRLLVNYDLYHSNNDNQNLSTGIYNGISYSTLDKTSPNSLRQEGVVTYQKRFNDIGKKLDFKYTYTNSDSDFEQKNLPSNLISLENTSLLKNHNFKIDYTQPLKLLDDGKISFGGLYEKMNFDTKSFSIENLNYQRLTASSYAEIQQTLKKVDFILGARLENYDIGGQYLDNSNWQDLRSFNKTKIFPNASVQYNFMKDVFFNVNYNKKISLPSISELNPNNSTYQNANSSQSGNANLQPTLFDNFEAKISAFNYVFVGYNVSYINDQVATYIIRENGQVVSSSTNISKMKIHNFNAGIPIPFMIFKKSIKEMLEFNFNPDEINFLYLYAGYQKHDMPDISTKGFWMYNVMSQIILPKKIKFTVNYSYLTPKANYFYFYSDKPFNNSFDVTFTKKFMGDRLNVSLFGNDIFNQQRMGLYSLAQNSNIYLGNKTDSRRFGISVNYKIPTKNKLAKEDPNLLNKEKKEDNNLLNQ